MKKAKKTVTVKEEVETKVTKVENKKSSTKDRLAKTNERVLKVAGRLYKKLLRVALYMEKVETEPQKKNAVVQAAAALSNLQTKLK